jgi:hypothetical protein
MQPALSFGLSLTVSLIFIFSGLSKLQGRNFLSQLADYRLLPPNAVVVVAWVLPWVELALGTALLFGLAPAMTLAACGGLLAVFTVAVIVNLVRGRQIACGCRGGGAVISWRLVAVNLSLIIAIATFAVGPITPVLPSLVGRQAELPATDALAMLFTTVVALLTWRLVAMAAAITATMGRTESALSRVP